MRLRRGRMWGPRDTAIRAELDARSWGFGELQRTRYWAVASWLPNLVFGLLGTHRRGWGILLFLAAVVEAYRRGAIGVLASYEECQALFGVASRDTWRRWTAELEAAGVIRVIQTWAEDRGPTARPRRSDRLHYRVGPAIEHAAGFGILEGAAGLTPKLRAWAERSGSALRARARDERRERKGILWARVRGTIPEQTISETEMIAPDRSLDGCSDPSTHSPAVRQSDPTPSRMTGTNRAEPVPAHPEELKSDRAPRGPSGPVIAPPVAEAVGEALARWRREACGLQTGSRARVAVPREGSAADAEEQPARADIGTILRMVEASGSRFSRLARAEREAHEERLAGVARGEGASPEAGPSGEAPGSLGGHGEGPFDKGGSGVP